MAAATTAVNGYLTSTDWTTFNNKQAGPLTSDVTTSGTTATIAANAVALSADTTGNYVEDVTAGAGLAKTSSVGESQTVDLLVDSSEAAFLKSGALTCGAGTAGKMQVHTTPLQYCDNAATPTLRYGAYADSNGNALTGDTATAFFSVGTLEVAIGGTGTTTSTGTGSVVLGTAPVVTLGTNSTVPNGANPTVTTAGAVSVDTSATTGSTLRFYGDAQYSLHGYKSKSFVITGTTAASDAGVWKVPFAITIRAVHVLATGGTNVIGQLANCDANGASCTAVDSTDITATAGTNANDDGILATPSIAALNYVGWLTTSVSGTNTRTVITFEYTEDAVN
jgi:hypothetical protein